MESPKALPSSTAAEFVCETSVSRSVIRSSTYLPFNCFASQNYFDGHHDVSL